MEMELSKPLVAYDTQTQRDRQTDDKTHEKCYTFLDLSVVSLSIFSVPPPLLLRWTDPALLDLASTTHALPTWGT